MSQEKMERKISEIISRVFEQLKQNKRDRTVYMPVEDIRKLYESIIKMPGKKEGLSYDDVSDFVSENYESHNPLEKLKAFLNRSKECTFYFEIGAGYKMIHEYQLGTGILYSYESLPDDVKKRFTLGKNDFKIHDDIKKMRSHLPSKILGT